MVNPLLILSIITYVVISLFYMVYIHNNWNRPIELEIEQDYINDPSIIQMQLLYPTFATMRRETHCYSLYRIIQ